MDLNNLSICIGPCLNMDRWLFNFLVGDWRHCWQGCWTEKQTLDEEKLLSDPRYIAPSSSTSAIASSSQGAPSIDLDERAISSGTESGLSGHELPPQIPERPRRSDDDRHKQSSRPRGSGEHSQDSCARGGSGRRHPQENIKPNTYVPSSVAPYLNGNNGRIPTQSEVRRPSTAEHRAAGGNLPSTSSTGSPGAATPKPGKHNRSQSDLPTPSQATFPDPFGSGTR